MLYQEKDNKENFFTMVCMKMFEPNWISFFNYKNLVFILFELLLLEQISV